MNKDEKLIETLINATERNKAKWSLEDWSHSNHFLRVYSSVIAMRLTLKVDKENTVVLIKNDSFNEEKVELILFNKVNGLDEHTLTIEEGDIEQPHRLWTLYKLADRNASGVDRIIDDIISKFTDDFTF